MDIQEKIKELGLTLPPTSIPGGNYVPLVRRGNIGFIAIQFPKVGSEYMTGKLGPHFSTEQGYQAAQLCALNVVQQLIANAIPLDAIAFNHFDGYYQATGDWDEAPRVFDGASDLFVNLFGENGRHTRAIFGVERLPRNFPVGITITFTYL
jgi:enamine deaminase RidA (YjgF/YER057c/UK114 family)